MGVTASADDKVLVTRQGDGDDDDDNGDDDEGRVESVKGKVVEERQAEDDEDGDDDTDKFRQSFNCVQRRVRWRGKGKPSTM